MDRQSDAWIGDAVLSLWARLRILREGGGVDGPKMIRMTSNAFLGALGEPTSVEAEIGRIYRAGGEAAAFEWMEREIAPLFARQEENRLKRGRLK